MKTAQAKEARIVLLPFNSIRHISSPEDQENNRKVYVGQAPVKSILNLTNQRKRSGLSS